MKIMPVGRKLLSRQQSYDKLDLGDREEEGQLATDNDV